MSSTAAHRPGFRRLSAVLLGLLGAMLAGAPAHATEPAPPPLPAAPAEPDQQAGWEAAQSALCAEAALAAERRYATPAGLLGVIAKVESGRPVAGALQPWPWTIDVEGEGMFFNSRTAALAGARRALAQGARNVDVGCMQVNLQFHPEAFASLEDAFDPAENAAYAARFLRSLREGPAGGNWLTAIGLYHSSTPALAEAYRETVSAVAAGRPPPRGAAGPLYLRALGRGAVLISLAGGGTIRMVRRQPVVRSPRRLNACQIAALLGSYLRSPPAGCLRVGAHRAAR